MKVIIRDVTKGQDMRIQESFRADEIVRGRNDIREIGPIEVDLTATAESEDQIGVRGKLRTVISAVCSRCLTPHSETLVIPFDEHYRLTESSGLPADDDDDVTYVTDENVDLKPYVEEAVIVHLPYAPLCEEDCKGLCPTCGVNRNETECGCSNERIDPRLAGLMDFFKK
ncbi:YceD family protein [Paenibacillus marinisediminis]